MYTIFVSLRINNMTLQGSNRSIKKGLIMEGGAMRGMFTAGVIDVMMENEIEFDGAIGVSAGAAFGCNYKSKQPGRVIRYNMKYCKDPRFCSIRSSLKTGDMFGADFCYREIPERLDIFDNKTFTENPMEFYVVCTDVTTGKALYRKCKTAECEDLDWIRASASMPLVSKIVETGNFKLLDGGISDSIPLKHFERLGYNKNIVILTQPKGYIKVKNKAMPLINRVLKKYPDLISAMKKRHELYNEALQYVDLQEKNGSVFAIYPPESLPIKRVEHDPEILRKVYNIGRETAQNQIVAIKEFLDS